MQAKVDDGIVGYAYGGPFRGKSAYCHTVETTIYLDPRQIGKGYGSILYQALLDELTHRGYTQAIGVIALPNDASERLHTKLCFDCRGVLKSVGHKLDRWIDTSYWQRSLQEN